MNDFERYFDRYCTTDASDGVIRVFEYYGNLYHYFTTKRSLFDRTRETAVSSRHAKNGKEDDRNLRLRKMTLKEKDFAVKNGAEIICSLEFFKQVRQEFSANRGIAAEQCVRKFYGLEDYKLGDRRPYYECGDIELNGKQYSVKFDDASLTSYRLIEKAEKLRG